MRSRGLLQVGSKERDTITCGHCNSIAVVPMQGDLAPPIGRCLMCDQPLCARCGPKAECTPFEKQLEAIERQARLMRALKG